MLKQKRAFIIHRWDANPNMDWYPWLKKELEKKGFKVEIPEMPNTSEPIIDSWVSHLKKIIGRLDEETYFIAHSIGCQAVMRFLEKENYEGKIGKIIFVAGWFKLDNLEGEEVKAIANPWINTPIEFNKVKSKLSDLTVFLSSNEPYGCIEENAKTFKEKLGAKVIIKKDKGHFTEDDGLKKLPEALKELDLS
jgi:predicted alpha/beta hydrolase family esterase